MLNWVKRVGGGSGRVGALTNLASSTSCTTSSLSSLSLSSNSCWSLQGGVKGQTREGSKRWTKEGRVVRGSSALTNPTPLWTAQLWSFSIGSLCSITTHEFVAHIWSTLICKWVQSNFTKLFHLGTSHVPWLPKSLKTIKYTCSHWARGKCL